MTNPGKNFYGHFRLCKRKKESQGDSLRLFFAQDLSGKLKTKDQSSTLLPEY